jgi:hypothetical protein
VDTPFYEEVVVYGMSVSGDGFCVLLRGVVSDRVLRVLITPEDPMSDGLDTEQVETPEAVTLLQLLQGIDVESHLGTDALERCFVGSLLEEQKESEADLARAIGKGSGGGDAVIDLEAGTPIMMDPLDDEEDAEEGGADGENGAEDEDGGDFSEQGGGLLGGVVDGDGPAYDQGAEGDHSLVIGAPWSDYASSSPSAAVAGKGSRGGGDSDGEPSARDALETMLGSNKRVSLRRVVITTTQGKEFRARLFGSVVDKNPAAGAAEVGDILPGPPPMSTSPSSSPSSSSPDGAGVPASASVYSIDPEAVQTLGEDGGASAANKAGALSIDVANPGALDLDPERVDIDYMPEPEVPLVTDLPSDLGGLLFDPIEGRVASSGGEGDDDEEFGEDDEEDEHYVPMFDDGKASPARGIMLGLGLGGRRDGNAWGNGDEDDESGMVDSVDDTKPRAMSRGKSLFNERRALENYKLSKLYSDAAETDLNGDGAEGGSDGSGFGQAPFGNLPVLSPGGYGRNMLGVEVGNAFEAIALALRHTAVIEVNSELLQNEDISYSLDELRSDFPRLLEADSTAEVLNRFSEDYSSRDEMERLQRQLFEALRQDKPDKIDSIKRQLEFYSAMTGSSVLLPPVNKKKKGKRKKK